MIMTINIGRYVPELTAMYASYRYSKAVFRNQKLRSQIAEQEFKDLFAAALPFLKDSANPKDVESQFRDKIHEQVV